MSSTALAERPTTTLATPAVTAEQLDLVKRTVASGATPAELQLYLYDCQRQGVHPLDRLLHFTKRGGKYTPVTSIDLMRSRAADTGEYAGSDDAVFAGEKGHDDFAATVTVWRLVQGQRCSFTATARWSEYRPDAAHMWQRMPHTMLAKCAEALALRKGFPRQLAGLYAAEEMAQADRPVAAAGTVAIRMERQVVAGNTHDKHDVPIEADVIVPVDTATGEELPEPPAGFHYLANYVLRGEWHEADLLAWDMQGGALHLSTKLQRVGALMERASAERIAVKADFTPRKNDPGKAYVNKLELDEAKPEPAAPSGRCEKCGRAADNCVCDPLPF